LLQQGHATARTHYVPSRDGQRFLINTLAADLTDDEDLVRITAYVWQVNGAKAGSQALTRDCSTVINSIVE